MLHKIKPSRLKSKGTRNGWLGRCRYRKEINEVVNGEQSSLVRRRSGSGTDRIASGCCPYPSWDKVIKRTSMRPESTTTRAADSSKKRSEAQGNTVKAKPRGRGRKRKAYNLNVCVNKNVTYLAIKKDWFNFLSGPPSTIFSPLDFKRKTNMRWAEWWRRVLYV